MPALSIPRSLPIAVATFVALWSSQSAFAGTHYGRIVKINSRHSDGLVHFFLSGEATGRASCAKFPYWVIRDENSAAGKRQFAMLLMAQSTGQSVYVTGSNSCARWSDGEDVDMLELRVEQ